MNTLPTEDQKYSVEDPPIELVKRYAKGLAPRSAVGVELHDKPKVIKAISSALVIDGVRQDYLDGHEIAWIEGRAAFQN